MNRYGCRIPIFTPARNDEPGYIGAVPAPKPGQGRNHVLCADQQWRTLITQGDSMTMPVMASEVDLELDTVVAFNNAVT